jgi:uncharacterized protein (TIGR03000 family)
MYSLVVMAALTTGGTEAPAFGNNWFNYCTLDSCLPIRYGWKSYGCVLCTPIHVPHGCYGGCYGCYGYSGGGCYGYGRGYWHFDGLAAGAGYAGFGAYGNYGFYGSYSVISNTLPEKSVPYYNPMSSTPSTNLSSPFEPLNKPKEVQDYRPMSTKQVTATIVMEVPENAKVYIDGNPMKSTSARRVFTTPKLESGQDYFYTIKVVMEQDGKKMEDSQKVIVRGGEETATSFAYLKNDRPAIADASRK